MHSQVVEERPAFLERKMTGLFLKNQEPRSKNQIMKIKIKNKKGFGYFYSEEPAL
jgi:hypothetical protein